MYIVAMVTAYVVGSLVFPTEPISKGGTIDTRSSVLRFYCLEVAALLSQCSNLLLIDRLLTY